MDQQLRDAVEEKLIAQTGPPQVQNYFNSLYASLPSWVERFALGTVETEALFQLGFTEMVNRTLSINRVTQNLMSGYRDLSWISSDHPTMADFVLIVLEARPDIRQAYWQKSPTGKKRLVTKR